MEKQRGKAEKTRGKLLTRELLAPSCPSRAFGLCRMGTQCSAPVTLGLMEITGQASNPWPLTASAKHTEVFALISRCSPVGYLIYSMPVNIHFTPKQGQVHHFCNHHLFMS